MAEVVCGALLGIPGLKQWERVPQVCCADFESALHGQLGLPAEDLHRTGDSSLQCHRAQCSQFYSFYSILPDGTCCCRPSSAALCVATPVVEWYLYTTIPGAYTTLCHGLVHCGEH